MGLIDTRQKIAFAARSSIGEFSSFCASTF